MAFCLSVLIPSMSAIVSSFEKTLPLSLPCLANCFLWTLILPTGRRLMIITVWLCPCFSHGVLSEHPSHLMNPGPNLWKTMNIACVHIFFDLFLTSVFFTSLKKIHIFISCNFKCKKKQMLHILMLSVMLQAYPVMIHKLLPRTMRMMSISLLTLKIFSAIQWQRLG